jgi:hypothetical protein
VSDFAPSTPKIDEIVQAHTTGQAADFERLKEALKNQLASTAEQAAPAPKPVTLPANQQPPTHLRVFYINNDRHELVGHSDAELLEKERWLREMYGSR